MKLFKNSFIIKFASVVFTLILILVIISLPVLKFQNQVHADESVTFTEFPVPHMNVSITTGPDGNLWFTEDYGGYNIARITPTGTVTEFPIPDGSYPTQITTGPDGNLWFTSETGNYIGRITPTGTITEFPLSTNDINHPFDITTGPDGNLWFTENGSNKIGRITPSGTITEFPITTNEPLDITTGPDGNLWFTSEGNDIGKITPTGMVTEFPITTTNSYPYGITTGPDGNLWFTQDYTSPGTDYIGRITPSGTITEFPIPTSGSQPIGITNGPDGNLWFTEWGTNNIGRITPTGTITEFPLPTSDSEPVYITTGPDGNLWFTEENATNVGRVTLSGVTSTPSPTLTPTPTPTPTPSLTVHKDIGWSGYGVQKDAKGTALFTSVYGMWQVPSVSCMNNGKPLPLSGNGNVWIWVGLGGASVGDKKHLEQVGISIECDSLGQPHYAAFFEAFATKTTADNNGSEILIQKGKNGLPTTPQNNQCDIINRNTGYYDFNSSCYKNAMPVYAGDKISAAVYRNSDGSYSVTLDDDLWNGIFGTTFKSPGKPSTAEWIVEDEPLNFYDQSLLAAFDPITFTNSLADDKPISGYPLLTQFQIWNLVNNKYVAPIKAIVGPLQNNGTAFTTQWQDY